MSKCDPRKNRAKRAKYNRRVRVRRYARILALKRAHAPGPNRGFGKNLEACLFTPTFVQQSLSPTYTWDIPHTHRNKPPTEPS